jgi:hypothetical protein
VILGSGATSALGVSDISGRIGIRKKDSSECSNSDLRPSFREEREREKVGHRRREAHANQPIKFKKYFQGTSHFSEVPDSVDIAKIVPRTRRKNLVMQIKIKSNPTDIRRVLRYINMRMTNVTFVCGAPCDTNFLWA